MLPSEQPDRIHVAFDDHRLVANAGLLLAGHPRPATWDWVNSSTTTLTSELRSGPGERRATKC